MSPYSNVVDMLSQLGIVSPTTKTAKKEVPGIPISVPPEQAQRQEKPLPYMATGWTPAGEPYYGEGRAGFIRKTWGNLADPTLYTEGEVKADTLLSDFFSKAQLMSERLGLTGPMFASLVNAVRGAEALLGKKIPGSEAWAEETSKTWLEIMPEYTFSGIGTWDEYLSGYFGTSKQLMAGRGWGKFYGNVLKSLGLTIVEGLYLVGEVPVRKAFSAYKAAEEIADIEGSSMGLEIPKRYGDARDFLLDIAFPFRVSTTLALAAPRMSDQEMQDKVKVYLRSSEVIYSAWWNEAYKNELVRRIEGGENPDYVIEDLTKKHKWSLWVEFGGAVIFDLLNLIPVGRARKAGRISKAAQVFDNAPDAIKAAVKGLEMADDARAIQIAANTLKVTDDLIRGTKTHRGIIQAIEDLSRSRKLWDLTADGKRFVIGNEVGTFMRIMSSQYDNVDEMTDVLAASHRLFNSLDDGERIASQLTLLNSKMADMWFSRAGLETQYMLSKIIGPDSAKFLDTLLKNSKDIETLSSYATRHLDDIVAKAFPSVNDMEKAAKAVRAGSVDEFTRMLARQWDELGPMYKVLNKTETALNKIYNPFNRLFSQLYMGYSPAYAMRNMMQNTLIVFADEGLETGARGFVAQVEGIFGRGKIFDRNLDAILRGLGIDPTTLTRAQKLALMPEGVTRGLGVHAAEATFKKKAVILRVNERIESACSLAMVSKVFNSEMKKFMKQGLPAIDELLIAGMTRQEANLYLSLLWNNGGNRKLAEKALRQAIGNQSIKKFRVALLPGKLEGFVDEFVQLRKIFDDVRMNSKSVEELRAGVDEIRRAMIALAKQGANNPATINLTDDVFVRASQEFAEAMRDSGGRIGKDSEQLFNMMLNNSQAAKQEIQGIITSIQRRVMDVDYRIFRDHPIMEHYNNILIRHDNFAYAAKDLLGRVRDVSNTVKSGGYKSLDELVAKIFYVSPPVFINVEDVTKTFTTGAETLGKAGAGVGETIARTEAGKKAAYETFTELFRPSAEALAEPQRFLDELWDFYHKWVGLNWRAETDDVVGVLSNDIFDLCQKAGIDITVLPEYQHLLNAETLRQKAKALSQVQTLGDWVFLETNKMNRARKIASLFGIPSVSERGIPLDKQLIRIINENLPEGRKITTLDVDDSTIIEALTSWARGKGRAAPEGLELLAERGIPQEFIERAAKAGLSGEEALNFADAELRAAVEAIGAKRGIAPEEVLQMSIDDILGINTVRGGSTTVPDAIAANLDGFLDDLGRWERQMVDGFNEKIPLRALPEDVEKALTRWNKIYDQRITKVRTVAMATALEARNFALLPYGDKRYFDLFLQKIFPYQYWYSRTYMNAIPRLVMNPQIAAAYGKYRRRLEVAHAGLPEWWKYNITTNDLPGIETDNPLFFNLEATLNPLYGILGTDYNDSAKRVNWYSRAVDDLGKFGPSVFTPLQWAVGTALYMKGENEAASRWMGRLIPQSVVIKSTLHKLGVKTPIPYNEIDPWVQIFSGGLDYNEIKRVGRALGAWVDEAPDEETRRLRAAQAQDAAHTRSGPIWDMAVQRSQADRGFGNLASFFLGVGFRSRNKSDVEIDNFYNEYFSLMDIRPDLSPNEFRDRMTRLKQKYPWMDTLLISRRPDDERDTAYAYTVLTRIPPGQSTELFELVGIRPELVDSFYDQKGTFDGWTTQDRGRFMDGVVDLGALLAIPDDSTSGEWNEVKNLYNSMKGTIQTIYGNDIYEKIDYYYSLETTEEKKNYLFLHPEVDAARNAQNSYVLKNELLYKYYGGLDTLDRYYSGRMQDELNRKYGEDMQAVQQEYYTILLGVQMGTLDKDAAKKYYQEHNLKAYYQDKAAYQDYINRNIAALASKLPDTPQVPVRQDFVPVGPTQTELLEGLPKGLPTWEDWIDILDQYMPQISGAMQEVLQAYFLEGEELPSEAEYQLDYLADRLGYSDGDQILQAIGASMQQVGVEG